MSKLYISTQIESSIMDIPWKAPPITSKLLRLSMLTVKRPNKLKIQLVVPISPLINFGDPTSVKSVLEYCKIIFAPEAIVNAGTIMPTRLARAYF